ncbi:MAG: FadR family transcriptional regulator [Spirochaetales bacterium]|jgi:GntR family transcriptional repressor for pyruvate dehydrogenase complex|nr:FadR family transcriptional regulator [Spirochaetales bacterium]
MSNEKNTQTLKGSSVVHKIRRFILDNELQPGDRLPTHKVLSEHLDIGIRMLREGLSVLAQHGLVETRRKGGTLIKAPSIDELSDPIRWHLETTGYSVEDLIQARAAVESAVAAIAAERRTARDLLVILDELERMKASTMQEKKEGGLDQAFHIAVLRATHNPVMDILGEFIVGQFRHKVPAQILATKVRLDEVIKEHEMIYQAIERQDADEARKHMYNHITYQTGKSRRRSPRSESPKS